MGIHENLKKKKKNETNNKTDSCQDGTKLKKNMKKYIT